MSRGRGKGKAISFKSLASVGWGEEKRVSVCLQLHKSCEISVKIRQFPRNSALFLRATKYYSYLKEPG